MSTNKKATPLSLDHQNEVQRKILKLRWEAMRRDPEYRQSYEECASYFSKEQDAIDEAFYKVIWDAKFRANHFAKLRGVEGSKQHTDFIASLDKKVEDYRKPSKEAHKRFKERFGFASYRPLNPDKTFEEIEPYLMRHTSLLGYKQAVSSMSYEFEDQTLTIKIQVDKINSKAALLKEIKRLIDDHSSDTKGRRIRDDQIDIIFRCGELKAQGFSNVEIGKLVYPNDWCSDSRNVKVSQRLKEYNMLVGDGGYCELQYP